MVKSLLHFCSRAVNVELTFDIFAKLLLLAFRRSTSRCGTLENLKSTKKVQSTKSTKEWKN